MDRTYHLLVVDDKPEEAAHTQAALHRGGDAFSVKRVDSWKAFQLEIELAPPDLIVAEYAVGDFHIVRALQWLQETGRHIPVIVVTGPHTDEEVAACLRHGARDYLRKGNLLRLPGAALEIVRQRYLEKERAATEAPYRLMTQATRDLISLLDRNYHVVYASPSFQRVLSHDPAALESLPFPSLVHPEDLPSMEKTFEEAHFFLDARNVELRLCHSDGTWHCFEATISHMSNPQGQWDRALVVSRDISDRKRAEKEIRKLAAFARFNPNPVLEFAADGTLGYFNDAAMNMARRFNEAHPDKILPLSIATIVKQCLATGESQLHFETQRGGRWLSWSFFPIQGNQVVHGYAEDITESRQLEATLRQAQKMESVGQLAAGVAHDFNNILTVIQGHANLMLGQSSLAEMERQSTQQIVRAAERGAGLTRQLLVFSRKQMLQRQLLDLNEVIQNVTKMLRTLLGERITLNRHLGDRLPAIHADPCMIEQILVNLVVNARDAIRHSGTITLETRACEIDPETAQRLPQARPGSFVCLSVSDTGHGMDEETVSHIFEPFFTTKEAGRGTGLGLATVYSIVKQHEGWIEVASETNRGSTFRVYLPTSTKAPRKNVDTPTTSVPGGTETILVVEDETSLRELVSEILRKKGYRILAAPDGVKALELWQTHKHEIALLLTDMMMPGGLSGGELAERVLKDKPTLKVLYSSGYSLESVEPGFSAKPGTSFLQKPYPPETLAQAVRACLNGE